MTDSSSSPPASDAPSSSSSPSPGFVDLAFTVEPQDTVTVRGGALRLDCQAQAGSAAAGPVSITWRKDGVLLSAVVDERRRQLDNGTLTVQNVVHSRHHRPDEGEYQCLATLDGLGSIVSRTAKVTVAGEKTRRHF
uniref:Ig-like domain-containing protein n=1 Tax=Poecilia latipinna TaxID=48699 RepID=A0A3B3VAR2_9TELE